jgi:hypothetical protein
MTEDDRYLGNILGWTKYYDRLSQLMEILNFLNLDLHDNKDALKQLQIITTLRMILVRK